MMTGDILACGRCGRPRGGGETVYCWCNKSLPLPEEGLPAMEGDEVRVRITEVIASSGRFVALDVDGQSYLLTGRGLAARWKPLTSY